MKHVEQARAEGILFTDMYQLTMGQLYFRMGLHERPAQFEHFFRSYPDYGTHQAGYCINAGLEWLLDWMQESRFHDDEIAYLRGLTASSGKPLFDDGYLNWLRQHGTFDGISLQAIPEGRVVHPLVPLTVVQGPLLMAQILETPLLNMLNYQTLIATKAARIRQVGRGQLMLEFGLRRAHDRAATAGARAALIGGADFTSNVGSSRILGLPPKGTHAHSMVQLFMALGEGELNAFRAYAETFPDDCLLLVDTVNTLESGIPNAITVFEELRRKGHRPMGVRLDSGDLAYLSIQAAQMLNEAGFPDVSIVLSNQLDELTLLQIIAQIVEEAPRYDLDADQLIGRLVYGVGTRLITSAGDSSLDGVYKLVAVQNGGQHWQPAIKISETPEKTLNPGQKQVWRLYDAREKAIADLISTADEDPKQQNTLTLHHPTRHDKQRTLEQASLSAIEQLLVTVMEDGKLVYDVPPLEAIRQQREDDLERLDAGVRRIISPHIYHVSLSEGLWGLKQELIDSVKEQYD
ncbi:MAG: nicotinate phosphoribosyltransferase [Anaerolineae bacterium]